MNEVKDIIDKFIRRYFDLEIVVSPDARGLKTVSNKMFSDLLGNSIFKYISCLDEGTTPTAGEVADCFAAIAKSYANGFVVQGQDLLRKLDECRTRNTELISDLSVCMANYTALQKEHQRLVQMLDQNQTGPSGQQSEENE